MALKAVIDNLDSVEERHRDLYVEKDGKFYLDIDDSIRTHTSVLPLSNSLTNVKREKQALQRKIEETQAKLEGLPDDFDPADYQRLKEDETARLADPNHDKGKGADEHMAILNPTGNPKILRPGQCGNRWRFYRGWLVNFRNMWSEYSIALAFSFAI